MFISAGDHITYLENSFCVVSRFNQNNRKRTMNGAGVKILTFNFRTDFSVGRSGGNFILGFSLRLVILNVSNLACYGQIRLLGLWFCFSFVT